MVSVRRKTKQGKAVGNVGMGPFRWGGQEVHFEKRWKAMRERCSGVSGGEGRVVQAVRAGGGAKGLFQKGDPGLEKEGPGFKGRRGEKVSIVRV